MMKLCRHCGVEGSMLPHVLCVPGLLHDMIDVPNSIAAPKQPTSQEPTSVKEILDQRGSRYGCFADNSRFAVQLTRMIFSAQQERTQRGQLPMTEYQINALCMMAGKMSRIVTGDADYEDNWIDIAGYAELGRNPR